jgi:hypothetical protein
MLIPIIVQLVAEFLPGYLDQTLLIQYLICIRYLQQLNSVTTKKFCKCIIFLEFTS